MTEFNQETIDQMLADHLLWLRGEGGDRLVLHDVTIKEVKLNYACLRESIIINTEFLDVSMVALDLRGAVLDHVCFSGCDLTDADLTDTTQNKVSYSDCDLTCSYFVNAISKNTTMEDVDLSCIKASGSLWSGLRSIYACSYSDVLDIRHSILSHVHVTGGRLRRIDLKAAVLDSVFVENGVVSGVITTGSTGLDTVVTYEEEVGLEDEIDAMESVEESSYDVILKSAGTLKLQMVKTVKDALSIGLKEAKDLVDNTPSTLKESIDADEAEALKAALEDIGAKVMIIAHNHQS